MSEHLVAKKSMKISDYRSQSCLKEEISKKCNKISTKRTNKVTKDAIAELGSKPKRKKGESKYEELDLEGTRNLVRRKLVRIDPQDPASAEEKCYANIQIQLNRKRRNSEDKTSIAGVLVQISHDGARVRFPIRYIRHALLQSLKECKMLRLQLR